jgi:hypothetical protein
MGVAGDVLSSMAGLNGVGHPAAIRHSIGITFVVLIVAALAWVNLAPNTWQVEIRPRPLYGLVLGLAMAAAILQIAAPSPFLYFQF